MSVIEMRLAAQGAVAQSDHCRGTRVQRIGYWVLRHPRGWDDGVAEPVVVQTVQGLAHI